MIKTFFAVVAVTIIMGSCAAQHRQAGNAEKLDLFHQQKQVR